MDASDATLAIPLVGINAPIVMRVHGLDLLYQNPLYQSLLRRALPKIDLLVANSRPTARLLESFGIPEARIRIVHPAADAPRGWMRRTVPGRVLIAGRFVARKGFADFIQECWPTIVAAHPAATLHVVGAGPEVQRVEQEARHHPRSVRLLGALSRAALEREYQEAQVFVMPNRQVAGDFEGFGIVAAEAAARGVPVVANAVDGIVDAVLEGGTGIRVDPSSPTSLAQAVLRVLEDGAWDEQAVAVRAAECFGTARLHREYIAVVEDALNSR